MRVLLWCSLVLACTACATRVRQRPTCCHPMWPSDGTIALPEGEASSPDLLTARREPPPVEVIEPPEATDLGPHYRVELRMTTGGRVLTAPTVSVKPGMRADVQMVNQKSFIQDIDVEVSGDQFIADPIVGIIQDGLAIELIAAPDAQAAETSWIAFHVTDAKLHEPMRSYRVRTSAGSVPATVQLPHLAVGASTGLRRVKHGEQAFLAEVHNGTGRVRIHARLTSVGDVGSVAWTPEPEVVEAAPEDNALGLGLVHQGRAIDALLHEAVSGKHAAKRIQLELVELPPSRRGRGRALGSLELTSASVPGVMSQRIEQRSYVQDFDATETMANGQVVADPLIGTIQSGVSASLTRVDGRLQLDLIWSELIEPIPDFRTQLGKQSPFTVQIQLPELRLSQSRVDLESGRITSPIGGSSPPDTPVDLRSGRVFVPIGKTIRTTPTGDTVGHLGVWIEIQDA